MCSYIFFKKSNIFLFSKNMVTNLFNMNYMKNANITPLKAVRQRKSIKTRRNEKPHNVMCVKN